MLVKVGILSAAHVHAPSFAACAQASTLAEVVGVWDDDENRGREFAQKRALTFFSNREDFLAAVDAVIICSENTKHAEHIGWAAQAGRAILCEKPVAPTREAGDKIKVAVDEAGVLFMTAFPCAFSPGFKSAIAKVRAGEIGKVVAVCATNQGRCPGGWFVEPELSGGGAMADHVVHVADLIRRILDEEPATVHAQVGSKIFGQKWEDTAILDVRYPSGAFATVDSSWSKPAGYRTWGNVKLNIIGDKGTLELDLFAQGTDFYGEAHGGLSGTGSNLDALMVEEFLSAIVEGRPPSVTLEDGLAASRVVWQAYASVG